MYNKSNIYFSVIGPFAIKAMNTNTILISY